VALVVLTNAYIYLNGASDISDHCSKVAFEVEADELDSTTFGSTGYKSMLGGLKSGNLGLGLKHDYAASNLDSILWPLLGTVVTFQIQAVAGTVTTSNPKYTGSLLISKLAPISGDVGQLGEFDVQWPTSGTITRGTS
jgi:hypothetical protein